MNAKTLITAAIALAGAIAVPAYAASSYEGDQTVAMRYTSTLSRAEVQQDAARARAMGQIADGEQGAGNNTFMAVKTRAQVRAETQEAMRLGAISRGEQNSFPSAEQLARIEMAGLQAVSMTMAAR